MSALTDYQYEILASEDETDGYVFGLHAPIGVDNGGFDQGTVGWKTQDTEGDRADGRRFGADWASPPTYAFEMTVDRETMGEAREELESLGALWPDEVARTTPGSAQVIRYQLDGQVRRVYGRPRRFTAPLDNLAGVGRVPVITDFACADARIYDDVEQVAEYTIIPPASGGLIAPLIAPLTSEPYASPRVSSIIVGGRLATPVVVKITGPGTGLGVATPFWSAVTTELDEGETIVIDPRPWRRTSYRELDGAGLGGRLTSSTRLDRMVLRPGAHPIAFFGTDTTGTATASLHWRSAYKTF